MIALFTDFGSAGPYVGQVKAVLARLAPESPVIDLAHDLAAHDARLAAYLLAALVPVLPRGTVVVAVVDPGVGGARAALALAADGRRYVGPDNGLLAIVARRAETVAWHGIPLPERPVSATFHGRDVFAPAAARLVRREPAAGPPAIPSVGADWPDDLARIVHRDRFGNAITGVRAATVAAGAHLVVGDRRLRRARTFSDVALGTPFWYANANGLVEIAVNQGSAVETLGLTVGDPVAFEGAPPA